MYPTRSGFLSVPTAMLVRTFTTADATPCPMPASHAHALSLPQGLTSFSLGHTPFILANTSNSGDTYNA